MTEVEKFLRKYKQSSHEIDIAKNFELVTAEIAKGVKRECSMPMIPTFIGEIDGIVQNRRQLLIDAGGTNFRSSSGYFDANGTPVIEDIVSVKMPGTYGKMNKDEFYSAIADNVKRLLGKTEDVGFCFSYNVNMGPDIDGTATAFSKELDASEVIGSKVGQCTLDAIAKIDEKKRRIVILNDTVATLLGGYANTIGQFSSYVGFIYGTGSNVCYIEDTEKLTKLPHATDFGKTMIVNMESGGFNKFVRGQFDKKVAAATAKPDSQPLEKMTSGKYLASILAEALTAAAKDKLFSGDVKLAEFTLRDVSEFLSGEEKVVYKMFQSTLDRSTSKELFRELIDRSARMWAIFNAAVIARVYKKGNLPVALVCEGTTFHRLVGFRVNLEMYLDQILKPLGVPYKIITGDQLNLVGTLMATMVKRQQG
jgi:hexokinase